MTKKELVTWIKELKDKNQLWKFYKSKEWMQLKESVLKEYHHECQVCKKKGIVTRYDIDDSGNKRLLSTVHHVQYVKSHPECALSRTYTYNGKTYPNLIPVCKACHNKLHDKTASMNALNTTTDPNKFVNEERW